MNGKFKFKLERDFTFSKRRYEIFVDGGFVGVLSNRNPTLNFETNLGTHELLVKSENSEKQYNVRLSSAKIIQPIVVNHRFYNPIKTDKYLNFVKILSVFLLIIYIFLFIYKFLINQNFKTDSLFKSMFWFIIFIPLFFTSFIYSNKNKTDFSLYIK